MYVGSSANLRKRITSQRLKRYHHGKYRVCNNFLDVEGRLINRLLPAVNKTLARQIAEREGERSKLRQMVTKRMKGDWFPSPPREASPRIEKPSDQEVKEIATFLEECRISGAAIPFEQWKTQKLLDELEKELGE